MSAQAMPHKRTFFQSLWYRILRLLGWNVAYVDPGVDKYVVIVAPHTSNFDFFIGFIFSRAYPLPFPHFMAKASVFRGVLGPLMRWLGGIPVDRSKRTQFVDQVAAAFASDERFVIAITPEGTRSHVPYWRSGFYHIALAAKVPIVMATIDYGSKLITYGASIMPTGDIDADMEKIRDFYQGVVGRHPERQGEIRLRPAEE